jgi:hypothetical protein
VPPRTAQWNFAGEDVDPRCVFKPAITGFWAEQDVPFCSLPAVGRYGA